MKQGILKTSLLKLHQQGKSITTEKDLEHLVLSEATVARVDKLTEKQWESEDWYKQKAGFITASKAKRIMTMQISMDKNLARNVSKAVEVVVHPKASFTHNAKSST